MSYTLDRNTTTGDLFLIDKNGNIIETNLTISETTFNKGREKMDDFDAFLLDLCIKYYESGILKKEYQNLKKK